MATITAGTYKVDKLLVNPVSGLTINVNFTCSAYHSYFGDMTLECSAIIVEKTVMETASLVYRAESASVDLSAMGVQFPWDCYVCDPFSDPNWNLLDYGSGVETIVITEDAVVDDADADWFNSNVKPQGGSSDTPTPTPATATITYNGSTIASLFGGQSATLKCKGDHVKMLSDIVVEVAEQEEQKQHVMQTLEVNITETGIFEFTPDSGYDGIIKVIVGVDAPQLTAPNISIDGDILTIEATDENTKSFAIFVDGIEVATVANEGV